MTMLTFSSMFELGGSSTVLNDNERGQIGVKTKLCTLGCTMGPPADNEYAVDPVGVDTIKPSATHSVRYCSSTKQSMVVK